MGLFPVLPTCNKYYACIAQGSEFEATSLVDCDPGKVFNSETGTCTDPADLEIDPLADCSGDNIVVGDSVECNAFHVCSSGESIYKVCCPTDMVFNVDTMICEEDNGQVMCPTVDPCDKTEYTYDCQPSSRALLNFWQKM